MKELQNQKQQLETKISELETQQAGQIKQWQKDKIAAELIELRTILTETDTKIENNPKHAKLASEFRWGKDLGGSDETIISQMHDKPIFVTHYPKKAKAFYMKADRDDEKVVLNFDMLAPAGFGEIIGGSMREDDHDLLLARTRRRKNRRLAHQSKTHPPVHPIPKNDGQSLYLNPVWRVACPLGACPLGASRLT